MAKKIKKKIIYTIGSAARSQDDFLKTLKDWGVKTLVDVRRFPTSKYERFKRENLDTLLFSSEIEYVYMGKDLGGFRKGGYEAYVNFTVTNLGNQPIDVNGIVGHTYDETALEILVSGVEAGTVLDVGQSLGGTATIRVLQGAAQNTIYPFSVDLGFSNEECPQ